MKTAVDVHNFLVERDVPHELVPLQGRVRTPERIAGALGLEPAQVGSVALFESSEGLVAALVRAGTVPDPDRVADVAGRGEVTELPPERVTDLTEFLAEALPPVALSEVHATVMDRGLERQDVLYFPGGEVTSVLKIRPDDLARACSATVGAIAR